MIRRCLPLLAVLLLPIRICAQPPEPLPLPEPGTTEIRVLSTEDAADRGLVLTARPNGAVRMAPDRSSSNQFWVLSPVGRRTFRLQLFEAGQLWSLAASDSTGRVTLAPSARDASQLWRVIPSLVVPRAARLENVAFPSRSLAGSRDSVVSLERSSGGAAQQWYLDATPPPPTVVLPTVQLTEHAVRAAPQLPPVTARLVNSHNAELWVVVIDLRDGQTQRLTIPAGRTVDVQLDRDAGATLVETYQVISPLGEVYREEFVTPVPPAVLYDLAVYERFLQSIAIDRTGKSPNKIEDVNYQPKGVGVFSVPPGNRFSGGVIDVYQRAKEARNAGGLRPIDPDQWERRESEPGPLERALEAARE